MSERRATRLPWLLSRSRAGQAFQLWMAVFFSATAAIVSGALPLEPLSAVALVYTLELATVAALFATYRRLWAPAARRGDRRLQEEERTKA